MTAYIFKQFFADFTASKNFSLTFLRADLVLWRDQFQRRCHPRHLCREFRFMTLPRKDNMRGLCRAEGKCANVGNPTENFHPFEFAFVWSEICSDNKSFTVCQFRRPKKQEVGLEGISEISSDLICAECEPFGILWNLLCSRSSDFYCLCLGDSNRRCFFAHIVSSDDANKFAKMRLKD